MTEITKAKELLPVETRSAPASLTASLAALPSMSLSPFARFFVSFVVKSDGFSSWFGTKAR
jgi:hypothetical protein